MKSTLSPPNLDVFFNCSIDLLAIVGTDGYFKLVNPAFERVLGYSEEELYARPVVEFLHPDDVNKTKHGIDILAKGIIRRESENRYRCKDGSYRWFSWNTTPVGPDLYTVGRDITEKIKSDNQIRELNLELERRNQDLEKEVQARVAELRSNEAQVQQLQKMDAIGRLAGGMAHDFNNLLGALSMYCDLISDARDNPEAIEENLDEVRKIVDRGAALTRQLLIFSRKQVVRPSKINLNESIQQLLKMLLRLIGADIRIVTQFDEHLYPVNVDPSQIEQVILNLVINSRDAMPRGGKITIETSNVVLDEEFTSTHLTVAPGPHALLTVSDTGSGMDTQTLSRIFEPFYTSKPVGKGTGLGLATVYGIIKQSRGTVWVYSEIGKGTVFKIYLPAAKESEIVVAEPFERPEASDSGTETLLLVEDDAGLRALYARALNEHGYQVIEASNGREASALLADHPSEIHLLLTDISVPEVGGIELGQIARTARPGARILYMSGYVHETPGDQHPGVENGTFAFIQKPFNTSALLFKIREVLGSAGPRNP